MMVYECETCETVLTPGLTACPHCGQAFDDPVPEDATTEIPPPPSILGESESDSEAGLTPETVLSFPGSPELGRGGLFVPLLPVSRTPRWKLWAKTVAAALLLAGAVWLGYRHWAAPSTPHPVVAALSIPPTDLAAHPQYAANMTVFVQKLRAMGVEADWPAFSSNDMLRITPQPRAAEASAAWNRDMYRRLAQGIYGHFAQNRYEAGFSETDTTACFVIVTNASGQVMAVDFMGNLQ